MNDLFKFLHLKKVRFSIFFFFFNFFLKVKIISELPKETHQIAKAYPRQVQGTNPRNITERKLVTKLYHSVFQKKKNKTKLFHWTARKAIGILQQIFLQYSPILLFLQHERNCIHQIKYVSLIMKILVLMPHGKSSG